MKWLHYILPSLVCSLTTVSGASSFFDSEKCLPAPESGEKLFPRCKECFSSVEFLYWYADEGALDYAVRQKVKTCPDSTTRTRGKVHRSSYDPHPGVRVQLGFYNAPKYWELFAQYTYLQTCGNDHLKNPADDNISIQPTFPVAFQGLGTELALAETHLKLNYQIVDVMFSRVFDPNPHLRLRLLSGITGAFINQDWCIHYLGSDDSISNFKNSWHYNAGGLRVGLSADWWWKWNLYFTGKVTLAGYSGRYNNRSKAPVSRGIAEFAVENNNTQAICYDDHRYAQHLQLLIGPSWHCIGNCYHAEFFVGYELNGWLNLQEVYRTAGIDGGNSFNQSTSALSLHGLTMRATVGF